MGRSRRGGPSDKENATANEAAPTRVASRPWDNLKPAGTIAPPPMAPPQMRAAPPDMCKVTTTKLPHERFTPLLRTTFSDDAGETGADDQRQRKRSVKPTAVRTDIRRESKSFIKTTTPIPTKKKAELASKSQRSQHRQSVREAVAQGDEGDDGMLATFQAMATGDAMRPRPFDSADSLNQTGVAVTGGGSPVGVVGEYEEDDSGLGEWEDEQSSDATALTSRPGSRHSVRLVARHSSIRNSAARHSVRGTPKPITGGMYSSDEESGDSDMDDYEDFKTFQREFGDADDDDDLGESASQMGGSSLGQTTQPTATPPESSEGSGKLKRGDETSPSTSSNVSRGLGEAFNGKRTKMKFSSSSEDEEEDENFIFVRADPGDVGEEDHASDDVRAPLPLILPSTDAPTAGKAHNLNNQPDCSGYVLRQESEAVDAPPAPGNHPPGPSRSKAQTGRSGEKDAAFVAGANEFPSLLDFLSYENDKRMKTQSVQQREVQYVPPATVHGQHMANNGAEYDEPDTFDTYASQSIAEYRMDGGHFMNDSTQQLVASAGTAEGDSSRGPTLRCAPPSLPVPSSSVPRLATNDSEKPLYPKISGPHQQNKLCGGAPRQFIDLKNSGNRRTADDDDEGEVFDAPPDMVAAPGIEPALRDLQRASIRAGNELAFTAFALGTAQREGAPPPDKVSRVQGQLNLRTRILRRWVTRYASIVDHQYFGAVLFLFCSDGVTSEVRTRKGAVALRNSKMIVLADTSVREIEVNRRNQTCSLFELRTAQRKYIFACEDDARREFWLSNLTMCIT